MPILHSEVFNPTTKSPAELLSEIPSEFFLVVAPSLITMSDSKSQLGTDEEIVDKYIHNAKLRTAIKALLKQSEPSKCLLTGYAVYNLMELYYSVDFNEDLPLEGNEDAIEKSFWSALFLLNEEFVAKSDKEANIIKDLDVDAQTKVMYHFITNINLFDITDYDQKEVISAQIVKAIQFFLFLENDKKYHPYLEAFYKMENVDSWAKYLKSKLALILVVMGKNDKTFHQVEVIKNDDYDASIEFLDSISYDEATASLAMPDFVGMRSKPLIKISDISYRVISKVFLFENLYKSLKFYFTKKVHGAVDDGLQLKGLYSFFTGEFAEDVVLYSALRNTFPDNWITLSGTDFLDNGFNKGEPDYYARKSRTAVLFESKDVVLTGAIKQSMDHSQIIDALRNKFNKKKKKKYTGQGILQIIENCKRLKQKTYRKIDHRYKEDKLIIYPVLLVHDRMFDTPGVNRFLAEEFDRDLAGVPDEYNKDDIRPLTVINIDTLIAYGEAIRDSGKDLAYFLDAYVKSYSNFKKTDKRMSVADRYLQEFAPFSKFLQNRLASLKIRQLPSAIMEHAKYLFEDEKNAES